MTPFQATPAFGLVVNAKARAVRRRHLRGTPFWTSHLPAEDVRVTRTLDELDEAIAAFRVRRVSVIAGLGGDGSLHHLVDALGRHYAGTEPPVVLALAGGTMNGVARALGTGGAPAEVLGAGLRAHASGRCPVQEHHLVRIDDAGRGTRYGFSFATGLVFRALEAYYRNPEPGIREAIMASLLPVRAALFGGTFYDPLALEVTADGDPWLPTPPHTLLASVLTQPLLWFRPFGRVSDTVPGVNLAATAMRPREIAPRLWSIFRGRCRHPGLRTGRFRTATVRGACGYLIDGDLYQGGTNVTISLGPRMRFLRPSP